MSDLLVKPQRGAPGGVVHHITPESAHWKYVGFDVHACEVGGVASGNIGERELCLVFVSGRGRVVVNGEDLGVLGERDSPFAGSPWSVYVPPNATWQMTATTPVELAVCSAPAKGGLPVRVIPPSEVGQETRGRGTNTRHVRNILPDTATAESLLVVEVITPGGNWSSYPPHKHDTDDFPRETLLEETYYHRLARGPGFALQRVYTDDRSLDETMAVADGDVVLVPKGYHPVGAPHGFDLYYLNVMAGPVRAWKFTMAPEHAFLGW
jgi:5-deoxy-glucuronate isomerase